MHHIYKPSQRIRFTTRFDGNVKNFLSAFGRKIEKTLQEEDGKARQCALPPQNLFDTRECIPILLPHSGSTRVKIMNDIKTIKTPCHADFGDSAQPAAGFQYPETGDTVTVLRDFVLSDDE